MKRSFIEYMTIVIAFFVLAATVVLSIGMAIGKKRVNNTQNETVKYYSEKNYYYNEADYNKFLYNCGRGEDISDKGDFVSAVSETVWVDETFHWNNPQPKSRLLTENEMEQYSKGSLTLTLDTSLRYSAANGIYYIACNAAWGSPNAEKIQLSSWLDNMDFLGITWGGNRLLELNSQTAKGVYHDGATLTTSRRTSDGYGCLIWQFKERKLSGYMKTVSINLQLRNIKPASGKDADIKVSYIHTYNNSKSIFTNEHFEYVDQNDAPDEIPEGYAPYINVYGKDFWRLDFSLPGLKY